MLELFSDFSYNDRLFFRFGKHTIKWGIGYFWSPADVLNLTAIDVENPTAERQGPVSLRIHYPFNLNNLYLYLITNAQAKLQEVAPAPKSEFVIGLTEIGIAGYYQRALSPRGILTFSSAIDEVDIFGEGVVSLGSNRVFVRESRKKIEDFAEPPGLSLGDLSPWGRHYTAVTAGWNNIFESDISVSVFNVTNLSDLSGIVSPSVSFNFIDVFDVTLSLWMTYGNKTDEYTNPGWLFGFSDESGATASVSLNISMGGGSF